MYYAILTSMKNSFNLIKDRVKKPATGMLNLEAAEEGATPFFTVDIELNMGGSVPTVITIIVIIIINYY